MGQVVEDFINERTGEATSAANAAKGAHDDLRNEARGEFEDEVKRQRTEHETLVKEVTGQADAFIADIKKKQEEVERLAAAVGRTGRISGFDQWANSERRSAMWLRFAALLVGIAAAGSVALLLDARADAIEDDQDVSAAVAVGAISIPAALGAVAIYAGRESARHRRNEVIARRTQIDIHSFGPFISELDEDEQAELTALFTPVFFGQAHIHTERLKDDQRAGPRPLLPEIADQIAERVKQWRSKEE